MWGIKGKIVVFCNVNDLLIILSFQEMSAFMSLYFNKLSIYNMSIQSTKVQFDLFKIVKGIETPSVC